MLNFGGKGGLVAAKVEALGVQEQSEWIGRVVELVGKDESELVGRQEWEETAGRGLSPAQAVEFWGLGKK